MTKITASNLILLPQEKYRVNLLKKKKILIPGWVVVNSEGNLFNYFHYYF